MYGQMDGWVGKRNGWPVISLCNDFSDCFLSWEELATFHRCKDGEAGTAREKEGEVLNYSLYSVGYVQIQFYILLFFTCAFYHE